MSVTTDERRFGGIGRLFGEAVGAQLQGSHVVVIGLGGVGSWAVEGLVRSGIGRLTLIDGDTVALSNTNRQLPALEGGYGRAKADVLYERCKAIHPDCQIEVKKVFVTPDNVHEVLPKDAQWIVDCIDDIKGKAAIHAEARRLGIRTVCAGGAGARTDPSRIEVSDLARVKGDPLLGKLRTILRKEYGFPVGSANGKSQLFNIPAVYSNEPLRQPGADSLAVVGAKPGERIGLGAFVAVTGTAGLRLASIVINDIAASIDDGDLE